MYVRVKEIDGHSVVCGFSTPNIDPEATKAAVRQEVLKMPQTKEADKAQAAIVEAINRRNQLVKELKRLSPKSYKDPKDYQRVLTSLTAAIERTKAEVQRFQSLLGIKKQEIYEKAIEIERDCRVLLANPNFIDVTEGELRVLLKLYKKLKRKQLLLADGRVVEDRRGLKYAFKHDGRWKIAECKTLLEELPKLLKPVEDLSAEEREEIADQERRDWLKTLKPGDIEDLQKKELANVAVHAALRERASYLSGEEDPEKEAKTWLEERQNEIRKRYQI